MVTPPTCLTATTESRLRPPGDDAYADFQVNYATLDRMPGSTIPVIRQPFQAGDLLPFWAYASKYETLLFDRIEDPFETRDISGSVNEADPAEVLRLALQDIDAPSDQFERLGLA